MIKSPDEALKNFNHLWTKDWHDLSESDTRCKIIDPLFKECLNWEEESIVREENVESGFIDYIFKFIDRPLFIIEAKKEEVHFKIPENFKNRQYKINGVIAQCRDLISAIEQAQKYCVDQGVRVGIVTNGYQYVIFEAFRLGSSWKEGKCIIFNSFEDISLNFGRFWNLLNKNSAENGSLIKALSEIPESKIFSRPLDKIHNKDEKLTRNYLHEYVSPFVEYIFKEITDISQVDLLKKCYVYEKVYGAADKEIENYFIDRMPHYSKEHNIKFFIEKDDNVGLFRINFEKCEDFVKSQTARGSMILLLGGIGAGKTTFLHRFFKIILKSKMKFFWFYIDFRTSPIEDTKIEDYIYKKIIKQFEEEYLPEVKGELSQFSINFDKQDPHKYVSSLFAVLRLMGYSLSLVVDNVDQHRTELQEKIFLLTEHITNELRLVSILALREESYYRSTLMGALDAYDKRKFHIPSPKFELVIENRIDYLLDLLKKPPQEIIKTVKTSLDIEEKIEEITLFFKIIKDSIRRKVPHKSSSITYFITEISAGNIRTALRMFNTYLISGNTKVEEMFSIYKKEGYQIAYFQFLKSVILGDSKYYIGDKSFIMNLFEVNSPYSDSHFLNIKILNFAYLNKANDSPVGRGFIEINRLKLIAEEYFINIKAIEDALLRLAQFDLVIFENQSKTDICNASYFSITSTGAYYLTQLTKHFIYLDLIAGDTPLCDINTEKRIKQLLDSNDMEDRFRKTDFFLKYLQECEDIEYNEHPEYYESDLTKYRFMKSIIDNFEAEKNYIRMKINKRKKF